MVLWILVGLCVGSFGNVVIYRLNNGMSPFKGRSICPKCKKQIRWFDNIPLLSFIFLRGRCRFCGKKISWQYPIVELSFALFTVFIIHYSVFYLLLTYCLLLIFFSDLFYGTILDEVLIFGVIISFIYLIASHFSLLPYLLSALGVGLFFYLLFIITKQKGMGFGDVKLAAFIGLFLGWPKTNLAIFGAFLTGALVAVILILLKKKRFGQTIPFGPFLALSAWIILIYGEKIWFYFN